MSLHLRLRWILRTVQSSMETSYMKSLHWWPDPQFELLCEQPNSPFHRVYSKFNHLKKGLHLRCWTPTERVTLKSRKDRSRSIGVSIEFKNCKAHCYILRSGLLSQAALFAWVSVASVLRLAQLDFLVSFYIVRRKLWSGSNPNIR